MSNPEEFRDWLYHLHLYRNGLLDEEVIMKNLSEEPSLETRASSAFVLGRLGELIARADKDGWPCTCVAHVGEIINDWKQAEAELKAQKANGGTDAYLGFMEGESK